MIVGIGLDVVELDRIAGVWRRRGARFAEKILRPEEIAALPKIGDAIIRRLAIQFAAKEAAVKALGTGFRSGVTFHGIETWSLPSGQPMLRFHDGALARAEALGVTGAHVSLTHGRDVAAAVVVLEGAETRGVRT